MATIKTIGFHFPFKYKLALTITAVVIGVLAGTFFVLQRRIEAKAIRGIKIDLQSTRQIVADLIEERNVRLQELARAVSGGELMRTILTDARLDRLTCDDIVLNEILPSYPQLSVLGAADSRGLIRANNPLKPDIAAVLASNDQLKSSFNGSIAHGFMRVGRNYHQIIALPLMIGPNEFREMLGVVFVGMPWTATDLAKLRRLSGADIALLSDNAIVSSAGPAFDAMPTGNAPTALSRPVLDTISSTVPQMHAIAGERFLFLKIGIQAETGIPAFAIARSLDAQLGFVQEIRRVMLEFAGVGIVLGVLVSFFIAMEIAKPVQTLTAAARHVAKDNFGVRVVVSGKDEFAELGDAFNQMIAGLHERDMIRTAFGRYVDHEVARRLLERPEMQLLGGQKRDVVIFMADIRGFSRLSEQLTPEQTVQLLNRYFAHIIDIIKDKEGVVVDFVGDGILALFDPLERDMAAMASSAVSCAFEMHHRLHHVNEEMIAEGLPPIAIGIGLNAGPAIVGNIGSRERAKFGIVGAEVNLTQRIQGEAKPGEVVVSAPLYDRIKNRVRVHRTFICELKGFRQPRTLHAVGPPDGDSPHLSMGRNDPSAA
ncbi:adenylate/guanylate cyclase domain-containing protein [Desulfatitalea tepidiphila]|uniref:adenylate/guanylate cyclase domain-containing protein n=1 Tax=Desulfatitalea tepidiphila TaxID=1185843 RepID=UPI0006B4FC3C|nr:adenylate/guanylate cyclase domain-containing protein [Desulfatitalea tepidiphila]